MQNQCYLNVRSKCILNALIIHKGIYRVWKKCGISLEILWCQYCGICKLFCKCGKLWKFCGHQLMLMKFQVIQIDF